jgi:hypothetical protein
LRFSLIDCDINASQLESVIEIQDCLDVEVRNNRVSAKSAASKLLLIARSEDMTASISNNRGINELQIKEDNGMKVSIKSD